MDIFIHGCPASEWSRVHAPWLHPMEAMHCGWYLPVTLHWYPVWAPPSTWWTPLSCTTLMPTLRVVPISFGPLATSSLGPARIPHLGPGAGGKTGSGSWRRARNSRDLSTSSRVSNGGSMRPAGCQLDNTLFNPSGSHSHGVQWSLDTLGICESSALFHTWFKFTVHNKSKELHSASVHLCIWEAQTLKPPQYHFTWLLLLSVMI